MILGKIPEIWRKREICRVEGNLEGRGDGFPNTSLVLVEHGYIPRNPPFCMYGVHYAILCRI